MNSPERDLWRKHNGVSLEDRLDYADNIGRKDPLIVHLAVWFAAAIILLSMYSCSGM